MMKPVEYPPCSIPDAMPRRRAGQCSSVRGMPAAQTPPMPMPNSARSPSSIPNVVENPLRHANIEYHRIENISGPLRPQRSAAVPAPMPPITRAKSVTDPMVPTSALLTLKCV